VKRAGDEERFGVCLTPRDRGIQVGFEVGVESLCLRIGVRFCRIPFAFGWSGRRICEDEAVDGRSKPVSYVRGENLATISPARLGELARGRHKLVFQASDYQESRNMEDVGRILPNTRTLTTSFRVK